eukprot:CAMPEP_0119303756 /NCGR_PEP_ID=MMETSP1333-20130426/5132_1 /TAXON_ID=418940 /ORGANISM="Scyphosphaera apsteinii, Strain RCC1455" /LENGTH=127 /DNA_ID=CAMNT_0007306503 /DNA_START=78 /DNA_END=458 /DNA_ORIENTATION=-
MPAANVAGEAKEPEELSERLKPTRRTSLPQLNVIRSSMLLAVLLASWTALAFLSRESCGCLAEDFLAGSLEGMVQTGMDWKAAHEKVDKGIDRIVQDCASEGDFLSPSVCFTACSIWGTEMQRLMMW